MAGRQQVKWTDEQRARALALLKSNAGNIHRTARDFGCPETTLRSWRDGVGPDTPDLVAEQTHSLAAMWRRIADKAGALTEDVLDAAKGSADPDELRTYATTAAIATDKVQLLSGEPTERTEHIVDLDLSHGD